MNKATAELWVTNVTDRKVVIGDLRWTIYPHTTVNLLDPRHSNLTEEQISESRRCGSLYKREKASILIVRETSPKIKGLPKLNEKAQAVSIEKVSFPFKNKSLVKLEEKKFEELEFEKQQALSDAAADLVFAAEQAEIDLDEHQPKVNIREKKKSKKETE